MKWLNALFTLVLALLLLKLLAAFVDWAVVEAVWRPDAAACRASEGACWGFIAEKHRFILFGTYPFDQHWRPGLAILALISLWAMSAFRTFWRWWLALIWLLGLLFIAVLMWGGLFGLPFVENERWGGLILTLLLTTFGVAVAFPLSIFLALGRRSELPLIRALCIGYIELIRGVPLITLLFMASVMLPLFLPSGVSIDKLLRAQIALILFAAAYLAEVVRGGLQAIPRGQYEAARALGLSY
ncbi:MAG TPA: ABC transporter permease subunit, partial [Burkholderiales bacterium]|nr:ABC transporter permease subunit [Burkholderiales bacterium]